MVRIVLREKKVWKSEHRAKFRFPAQIPKYFYCSNSTHSAVMASPLRTTKHIKHASSQIQHNMVQPLQRNLLTNHTILLKKQKRWLLFCHQMNIYHKLQMYVRIVEHHVIRWDTATEYNIRTSKRTTAKSFINSKTVKWFPVQEKSLLYLYCIASEQLGFIHIAYYCNCFEQCYAFFILKVWTGCL